jgi:flagellar motility protein MotE (MotC chaperone)
MSYHNHPVFSLILVILLLVAFGFHGSSAAEHESPSSSEFSSVEERRLHVRIIEDQNSLIDAKKALVLEEARLEKLKAEIDAKLTEIDRKLAEMEAQKKILEAMSEQKQTSRQERIDNLGKIYENMDPLLAAEAVSDLDRQVAAAILSSMKPRSAARILDGLSREQAAEISRLFLEMPDKEQ